MVLKWLLSLLIIILILTVAFKYSSILTNNSVKRKEESVSMAEMGKIIKDIRIMGQKRKEDIKENEKQFGGDE